MNALTRTRPTRRLLDLENEFNQMLDSVFSLSRDGNREETTTAVWAPRVDLSETEKAYRLKMDLPGLDKSDIHVRMEDNRLVVSGERSEETTHEDEDSVHSERTFGSFYRSIRLPKAVEEKKAEAHFKNGVLTIDLSKSEVSTPKNIEVT